MRKMLLTIIFIIVLALFVFAGCVSFVTNMPENPSGQGSDSQTVTYYVPATDENGEKVTDVYGSQVYIEIVEPVSGTSGSEYVTGSQQGTTQQAEEKKGFFSSLFNNDEKEENTTAPVTTAPVQQPVNQNADGYDILRSGCFYAKGSMLTDGVSTPLEMAITPNSIYMLTQFETTYMAILVSSGKTYLIYPEGKAYLELSDAVLKIMGIDVDELISSDDISFEGMQDLSEATGTSTENIKGKSCTVYSFEDGSGVVSRVCMSGKDIVGIEEVINGVVASGTYFDSVTSAVPADKINPPADYSKKGVFAFMSLLTDVMGTE